MKITASEIYRLQKIIDICQTLIVIWEELKRETTSEIEEIKIKNLTDRATAEFYLITEQMNERHNKC